MRKYLTFPNAAALGLALLSVTVSSPGKAVLKLRTPAEECQFSRYSQHEDVARFLGALDALSPETAVRVVGRSRETREVPGQDLYLCVLAENGAMRPEALDRSKPTLMITASQHGNEQSAKEAALALVRDLALGELRPLLGRVNVLVMPQCNPYGNALDRRQNEQDVDMNRDHVKMESEGVEAMHRVFRTWLPEATLDLHEKGDDYYRVSIGCVSNINIATELQDFSRKVILAEVEADLARRKIAFCEYVVRDEMGINTSTGAAIPAEALRNRDIMLRYSTTEINDGRNGPGIYQTLSFIQECASRHDLATLEERTGWQRSGLRAWIEAVTGHAGEVRDMVVRLRAGLLARAGTYGDDDPVHLRMEFARDPEVPQLIRRKFEAVQPAVRGVLKVDKRAGETVLASELEPAPSAERPRVAEEVVKNWFPAVKSVLAVSRPLGYIVPASERAVVENLLRHRVAVGLFTRDMPLRVEAYRVTAVEPAEVDWLPPAKIEVEKEALPLVARRGDFFVSCNQPAAALIPLLLEPQSQFGLICYRRFGLVPQAGEFFPLYRFTGGEAPPLVPYKDFLYE